MGSLVVTQKPVILVVEGDAGELARIEAEIASRYATHYEIVARATADGEMLEELVDEGREIALVLVDQWLPETTGVELLATVKLLSPATKRGLLVEWGSWGERATAAAIVEAMGLGHIDYYVLKPWSSPDELFHRTITTFLHEWSRSRPAARPQISVIGDKWDRRCHEVRNLLARYRIDHCFYPSDSDEGQAKLNHAGAGAFTSVVVVSQKGKALVDPTNAEIAEAFGVQTRLDTDEAFDVVVVGAGPGGLAAAVYGSSEGLRTLVVEREAIGGQAGASSLIRNYLGFARGIGGSELAQQAFQQAWVFGTRFLMTRAASAIRRVDDGFVVDFSHGESARTRSVVLATGVSYRRLDVPGIESLIGAGVFYGSSGAEAQAMKRRAVFIVGGGNSAGQAAIHLAAYASQVTLLLRSSSLAQSMSDYLIKTIEAADNIAIRYGVEVAGASGEGRLQRIRLCESDSGRTEDLPADALFVLIGAQPHTDWLPDEIERDRWGFILTGKDAEPDERDPFSRAPLLYETSAPGIFAVGDVRRGAEKRVASAVGEGSIAIRLVHEYLQELEGRTAART
jgi:thioredoxin reductase (NADPH)